MSSVYLVKLQKLKFLTNLIITSSFERFLASWGKQKKLMNSNSVVMKKESSIALFRASECRELPLNYLRIMNTWIFLFRVDESRRCMLSSFSFYFHKIMFRSSRQNVSQPNCYGETSDRNLRDSSSSNNFVLNEEKKKLLSLHLISSQLTQTNKQLAQN